MMETEGLDSKIELLRSQVFLKRTLLKLPLQISYFNKGTFKTYENYVASPYAIETNVKNQIVCGKPFFIKFLSSRECEITYNLGGEKVQQIFKINEWHKLPELDFRIKIIDFSAIMGNGGGTISQISRAARLY